MPKIWKQRPPASSLGGQVAWDLLSARRPDRTIVELWFAREMDDGAWNARYDDGEFSDVDVLVTRHRANAIRSATMHFTAGLAAARAGAAAVRDDAAVFLAPGTSSEDRAEFARGVANGWAERIARLSLVLKTSNARKAEEINRFGLAIKAEAGADLAEVDGTPEEVATYKALAAGPRIVVEDTSLDVEGFSAGVNIRWLLGRLAGQIRESGVSPRALWRVMLAVHDGDYLFLAKGEVHGRMIGQPRGEGFSFDPFFVPDGYEQTLGELDLICKKDEVSARKAAVENLMAGRCTVVPVSEIPAWTGAYQKS